MSIADSARLLAAENARLYAALERLASSEAFSTAQVIDGPLSDELVQRMAFAAATLQRAPVAPDASAPAPDDVSGDDRLKALAAAALAAPIAEYGAARQLMWGAITPDRVLRFFGTEEAYKVACERLSMASQFDVGRGQYNARITIEKRSEDRWVISNGTSVFNSFDEWEWEPLPSGRDEEFIARTRLTLEEAFARVPAALAWKAPR